MDLPSGTLTFLFTDVEGSTRLWESEPDAMRVALERHDVILQQSIETGGGVVVKTTGDGIFAAFEQPAGALDAALAMQRECADAVWPTSVPLRIRAGLHTGEAQLRDGDYFGPSLNRAARLMAAAHGGQTVCSASTAELVRDQLAAGVRLADLGEYRLRDLARSDRVFQVEHPELPRDFPPLRSIDTLPGNLPVQPNRFVGRHEQVEVVSKQLVASKVVTVTGPGGVGKTRLALQVAAAVQPDYADGAWFVDLAPIADPDEVAAELLQTLDYLVADGEDDIDGLCARLRRRSMLLILDNCEHLTAGVATVVDAISKVTDGVRILATSREGLGIPAEQVQPLPPLDTDPDGDATRLFVARALAARPNLVLDDANRATIVELCRRLDGIPLAIELAAARTRSLAPAQILDRIDERFRILTGGTRTSSARHQTLQAAVDWSYDLLQVDEQTVLNRLSVFSGGFTLDAAEAVVSDRDIDAFAVLDHLDALVDKSLVVADDTRLGRRYRLLETIRQYAADRLEFGDGADGCHARHATYYVELASARSPQMFGPSGIEALDALDADLDNLRQMFAWQVGHGRPDEAVDAMVSLARFFMVRDHTPWVILRLGTCIEATLDDGHRALAHGLRASFRAHTGSAGVTVDIEEAHAAARRAGCPVPLWVVRAAASAAAQDGDMHHACELTQTFSEEAWECGRDDQYLDARTLLLQVRSLAWPADPELADLLDAVRRDVERFASPWHQYSFSMAAGLARVMHDPDEATSFLEEALGLASELRSGYASADAHFFLGLMCLGRADTAGAARHCRRALMAHHDIGNRRGILMDLSGASGIALQTGRGTEVIPIVAGLRRARTDHDAPGSANEKFAEERMVARIVREFGAGALEHAVAGDLEGTIDLALDLLDQIDRDPSPIS